MLNSKELRTRAWESLKGKYWIAFFAILVVAILSSLENSSATWASKMIEVPKAADPNLMDYAALLSNFFNSMTALGIALVGLLFGIFVSSPLEVGLCNFFVKNTNSKPAISEIFSGFKTSYGRNVKTMLLMAIKLILWTLLFIIPGIIKSYEYAMIPYILSDNPELSSKEAFAKAKQMMTGNKWRLFKLNFSFIGWLLLCILTCGIGAFFLMPYIDAANAEFYAEIKNK